MGFQRFLLTLWEWEGSVGGDDGLRAVVFEREARVSKARIGVREWVREERQRGIGRRWEWDRELERKEETQEKVALGMGNAIAACFSVLDTAERFWNKLYACQSGGVWLSISNHFSVFKQHPTYFNVLFYLTHIFINVFKQQILVFKYIHQTDPLVFWVFFFFMYWFLESHFCFFF